MPNTEDLKGRVKEAAGDVTGDQDLKREGKVDQASASVKETARDAMEKVEEGVDGVKDRIQDALHRK